METVTANVSVLVNRSASARVMWSARDNQIAWRCFSVEPIHARPFLAVETTWQGCRQRGLVSEAWICFMRNLLPVVAGLQDAGVPRTEVAPGAFHAFDMIAPKLLCRDASFSQCRILRSYLVDVADAAGG